jgi:hypothetical protein
MLRTSRKVMVRVTGLAAISMAAAGLFACAPVSLGGDGGGDSEGDVGSVGLTLQAAAGVTIDLASYSVVGPGGVTRSGAIGRRPQRHDFGPHLGPSRGPGPCPVDHGPVD